MPLAAIGDARMHRQEPSAGMLRRDRLQNAVPVAQLGELGRLSEDT
jgi:hypothetical protein